MRYNLIAAMCRGRGIGYKGRLPWSVPEDLRLFSSITKGAGHNAVVMGRGTWESLPSRPLRGRVTLVLTTDAEYNPGEGALAFTDLPGLIRHCEVRTYDVVWVSGGEAIYSLFLNAKLVDVCVLTFIDEDYETDKNFPDLGEGWSVRLVRPVKTKTEAHVEMRQLVRVGHDIPAHRLELPGGEEGKYRDETSGRNTGSH